MRLCLQEQKQEASALEKAGRIMCNIKLAAAWRGWLDAVDQRRYLQAKLGSALNLFINRRLALAWQAWQVHQIPSCSLELGIQWLVHTSRACQIAKASQATAKTL